MCKRCEQGEDLFERFQQDLRQVRQEFDMSHQKSAALRKELRAERLLRAMRDIDFEHLRRLYRGLPKDMSGGYQLPEQAKLETDPS